MISVQIKSRSIRNAPIIHFSYDSKTIVIIKVTNQKLATILHFTELQFSCNLLLPY